MKKIYKILVFFIVIFTVSCGEKEKNLTTKDICEEKLPPFMEKFDNQLDKEKLKLLCNCIWANFPEEGWERRVSEKLYNGENIKMNIFRIKLKKMNVFLKVV